jgi:hypothetical protein
VARGTELAELMLKKMWHNSGDGIEPTVDNDWNGWFPSKTTIVTMILPAWDPNEPLPPQMVAFTRHKQGSLFVYPSQAYQLMKAIKNLMAKQSEKFKTMPKGYVRTYNQLSRKEPLKGDAREFVVARPRIRDVDQSVVMGIHYDGSGTYEEIQHIALAHQLA